MSSFARFHPRLQQAIVARLGWSSLRPVQDEAGAALLDGKNAVVLAPTAGGKTEASMFPTLSGMVADGPTAVGALYIAPIKALLNNQAERLGLYTEMVGLRRFVWHGDTPSHDRKRFLKEPAELLMTTPESLEVMLISSRVDAAAVFGDLRCVVIDEVHAMAGTDRGAHLLSVLERLAALSRHDVQRVGLSATVGNPEAILTWLSGTSKREGVVVNPPSPPGRRQLLVIHRPELGELARDAAKVARGGKSLFFCQSRAMTELVAEHMARSGINVFVHHSAVSREERQLAEEQFHRGANACIVCTSTLELGIDVGDLDRVLQAESPDTVSSFMQRMGRTGRREGQAANTTFFCETTEGVLLAISIVELAKTGWVEHVDVLDRCWPVLVHQLLALALAHDGVPVEEAWAHLSTVSDLSGIHRAEFDRLVSWMLRDRALILTSGRLVLGPKAERRFGRRNFMELFAVFQSAQSYSVQTAAGQPLGTLNQTFVDRLAEGVSTFLLGGRAWGVIGISHDDRQIKVQPAPRGRQPTWGGYLPQFLGFEVCQKQLELLTSDAEYPYLHADAAAVLAERREAFRGLVKPGTGGVEVDDDEIRWWTFAGGRINATLRYALEAVGGEWKVVPDNFCVKVRGADEAGFRRAMARISELDFWTDEQLWTDVATMLPNYRLSKFQALMPPWVERELVASYLLDVQGAWRWLSGASDGLERVPASVRRPVEGDRVLSEPLPRAEPRNPITWIDTDEELAAACDALAGVSTVALDVETTLKSRVLCLVQLATDQVTYVIDALAVELTPLAPLLASRSTEKLIHHADFEREVLAGYDLELNAVVDTLVLSRAKHGPDVRHSLAAVCQRELGLELDKTEQTSAWQQRPLTESQLTYAALDAELLLRLWPRLR